MARRPKSDIRVSASDALEFEPEVRKRRGIPTTVWLLLVLVLVTGAGLGGFLFGDRLAGLSGDDGDQVPVVHAAQGPIKVRPKNPGGQEIPFRNYDINKRMQGEEPTGRVENLLPPPEQPKELPKVAAQPAQPAQQQVAPPKTVAVAPTPKVPQAPAASGESLLPAAPPPAPEPTAPKQITAPVSAPTPPPAKTVEKAPTPKPAPQPAPQPAPPPPAPTVSSQPGSAPLALVPKSAQPAAQPKAVEPEPEKTVPKAAPAAAKTAPASGWQVQLAASRAATAAKAEGERLKKKHADVLGGMTVKIVRADLGAKGVFYRIRLGYAADKNKAREICTALSKRGQGCLVVAPGK